MEEIASKIIHEIVAFNNPNTPSPLSKTITIAITVEEGVVQWCTLTTKQDRFHLLTLLLGSDDIGMAADSMD